VLACADQQQKNQKNQKIAFFSKNSFFKNCQKSRTPLWNLFKIEQEVSNIDLYLTLKFKKNRWSRSGEFRVLAKNQKNQKNCHFLKIRQKFSGHWQLTPLKGRMPNYVLYIP